MLYCIFSHFIAYALWIVKQNENWIVFHFLWGKLNALLDLFIWCKILPAFFFFHVKYLFHLSTLSTISLFISIASKQHQLLKIFEQFSLEKAGNDFSGNLFLELWSPLGIHCCISHSLWNLMLYLPIILSPPHWFLAILSFWKSSTLTISAWNHNQWLVYINYVKNLTEFFMDQVHSQSESMAKIGEKTKSVLKLLKKIFLFILSIDISS